MRRRSGPRFREVVRGGDQAHVRERLREVPELTPRDRIVLFREQAEIVRERAFARLSFVENRRREPWAIESLQYLNHPLREVHARRFVLPALGLLREVQRTGDIFFPTRWAEATLNGHNSPEVAGIVQDFLASELQYPQRLRWTILTAADDLFRQTRPYEQ